LTVFARANVESKGNKKAKTTNLGSCRTSHHTCWRISAARWRTCGARLKKT